MHRLAVELLEPIFRLACVDGGYTGCSLSLVSHLVRSRSRTWRFHSISLVSGTAQQLAKFLRCFQKERAIAQSTGSDRLPTLRHLCISAAEGEEVRGEWRRYHTRDKQYDGSWEATVELERECYIADLTELIQLVGADLRTLSLVHSQGRPKLTRLPAIRCTGFPVLEELTITNPDPFIPDPGADCLLPFYPRLARLHLLLADGLCDEILRWADDGRAPHITHLRLSNLGEVSDDLKALVGM